MTEGGIIEWKHRREVELLFNTFEELYRSGCLWFNESTAGQQFMAYRTGMGSWIDDDFLKSDKEPIPHFLYSGKVDFFSFQAWSFEPKSRLATCAVKGVAPGLSQRLLWLIDHRPREITVHLLCLRDELSLLSAGVRKGSPSDKGLLASYLILILYARIYGHAQQRKSSLIISILINFLKFIKY